MLKCVKDSIELENSKYSIFGDEPSQILKMFTIAIDLETKSVVTDKM